MNQRGFTTIELLVTLFVATAFVGAFSQIFTVIDRAAAEARWQSAASNLAYSNLRRYATAGDTSFICNSTTNLVTNPSAPGQVLHTTNYSASTSGLPGTATVEVRAYAPMGCGTDVSLKIIATTTYGSPARKAVHATYVN